MCVIQELIEDLFFSAVGFDFGVVHHAIFFADVGQLLQLLLCDGICITLSKLFLEFFLGNSVFLHLLQSLFDQDIVIDRLILFFLPLSEQ